MSKKPSNKKGRRAVSNVGFALVPVKKGKLKLYAPVRMLSEQEIKQMNRERGIV